MIVANNNSMPAMQSGLNAKNTGDNSSPLGAFSDALNKLFSTSVSSSADASQEAVGNSQSNGQSKRSRSSDQDSSPSATTQTTDLFVSPYVMQQQLPLQQLPQMSASLQLDSVTLSGVQPAEPSSPQSFSSSLQTVAQSNMMPVAAAVQQSSPAVPQQVAATAQQTPTAAAQQIAMTAEHSSPAAAQQVAPQDETPAPEAAVDNADNSAAPVINHGPLAPVGGGNDASIVNGLKNVTTAPLLNGATNDNDKVAPIFNGLKTATTAPELDGVANDIDTVAPPVNGLKSTTTAPLAPIVTNDPAAPVVGLPPGAYSPVFNLPVNPADNVASSQSTSTPVATIQATASDDSTAAPASTDSSESIQGTSQDSSENDAPVQQPVNGLRAATPAVLAPLNGLPSQGMDDPTIGTQSSDGDVNAPVGGPVAAPVAPLKGGQVDRIPVKITKTSTGIEAANETTSAVPAHVISAMNAARQAATGNVAAARSNNTPIASAAKTITKRTDITGTTVPVVHVAPTQNANDQHVAESNTASSTTNGVIGASNTDAKQSDSDSSDSDRRSKDDVVSATDASTASVQVVQSAPVQVHSEAVPAAIQLQATPSTHGIQGGTGVSTSGSAAGSAPARLTETEQASSDVKPIVNTSKLIQTVNQSEMRVGMRTAEFGDISIRTSSTHDSILTQISLDHSELASSLTAHIPDMQARLQGHGNLEVRIDTSSQNAGTSSSTSDGRSGSSNSQGGRDQQQGDRSYLSSSYGDSSFNDSALPVAAAPTTMQSAWSTGRLDLQA